MPNIEEILRKAMEEGKFDNLPGKGKPLNMGELNPHADPEWELAYHVIKEAGYTLPWIETIKEIETDIEAARNEVQRAWKWYVIYRSAEVPEEKILSEWEAALKRFKHTLDDLNKRIRDYNLEVTNMHFQRPLLSYEKEVKRITYNNDEGSD